MLTFQVGRFFRRQPGFRVGILECYPNHSMGRDSFYTYFGLLCAFVRYSESVARLAANFSPGAGPLKSTNIIKVSEFRENLHKATVVTFYASDAKRSVTEVENCFSVEFGIFNSTAFTAQWEVHMKWHYRSYDSFRRSVTVIRF